MFELELALVGRAIAAFFSFLFCSASPLALIACSTHTHSDKKEEVAHASQ